MKILLFLKAPRPGTVKTRLAKDLGEDQACEAYKMLVRRQLENLPKDAELLIHFAPANAHAEMNEWLGPQHRYIPQCEGDLGQRLSFAVKQAFEHHTSPVFCIGSDCPQLETGHFIEANNHLKKDADLVLGPTEDGGYYLIGMTRYMPELFTNIAWSSEHTLRDTLKAANALNLSTALLEQLWDVDELCDWERACKATFFSPSRS
ncbi:TIGR04282 family arsenosugar biosynthesis glycosyltransferase [Kiritimatiellota bacterium B12222]|nr:TIGR04282 family arsenosugar biosynthesis glycosyltransferase [Kiritimatiellota bacterium B12222]